MSGLFRYPVSGSCGRESYPYSYVNGSCGRESYPCHCACNPLSGFCGGLVSRSWPLAVLPTATVMMLLIHLVG